MKIPKPKKDKNKVYPKLQYIPDEDVLEIVWQHCGVIASAARALGCRAKTLRNRLDKIDGGKTEVEAFRAAVVELCKTGILHHLKEMNPDIIKYCMTAQGGKFGFANRAQIHLLAESKETIDITDQSIEKLKAALEKSTTETIDIFPPEVEDASEDTSQ